MDRKVRGFTLIELLFIIAMLLVIGSIAVKEIIAYIQEVRLREAVNKFLGEIEYVKNQGIISLKPYGIRACKDSNKYKVFIDLDSDCKDRTPYCVPSEDKVCAHNPTVFCTSDEGICGVRDGPCITVERVGELPEGTKFVGNSSFYVVVNRMGYFFDYSCGFGAGSISIENALGKKVKITASRYGRISVEQ